MATIKPVYIDRFTMVGDDIPQSKPVGPPSVANRVYFSKGQTPGYQADTKFIGFQEPAVSSVVNRLGWALAENHAAIYEKVIAQPEVYSTITGGAPETNLTLPSGTVAFLGRTGATTSQINLVIDMLDANWDELTDGGTPPTQIVATDIQVTDPTLPLTFSVYPGGGLGATTTNGELAGVAAQQITFTAGFGAPAVGTCLINYDQWLRSLKDSGTYGPVDNAFASISSVVTPNTVFTVHRDVGAVGWAAGDNIYVTHFVFEPTIVVGPAIPAATNYKIVYGYHNCIGQLEENSLTSLKIRTAEEVPYELEQYMLSGLDGAYDQGGIGTPGGGRVVTVDSGGIEGQIDIDGGLGFVATQLTTRVGTTDFLSLNVDSTYYGQRTGFMTVSHISPTSSVTQWTLPAPSSGAGNTLTVNLPNYVSAGGNSDLYPLLDLVLLLDGSGNPVVQPGSPDGVYIIQTVLGLQTLDVLAMDGTVPADISATNFSALLRPQFLGMPGNVSGYASGAVAVANQVGAGFGEPAQLFVAPYDYDFPTTYGRFYESYVSNVNPVDAIMAEGMEQNPGLLAGFHLTSARLMGIVGDTENTTQVVTEVLSKNDATNDVSMILRWDEGSPSINNPQYWRYFQLGSPPTTEDKWVATICAPFGPFQGLANLPAFELSRTGMLMGIQNQPNVYDGARIYAGYHDRRVTTLTGAKMEVGIKCWFDNDASGAAGGATGLVAPDSQFSSLLLREYPTQTATGGTFNYSPQTPVRTLYGIRPGQGPEKHRLELDNNANYGFKDWKRLTKVISLAHGAPASVSWVFTWVVLGKSAWSFAGGPGPDVLIIPIEAPHGAELVSIDWLDQTGVAPGPGPNTLQVSVVAQPFGGPATPLVSKNYNGGEPAAPDNIPLVPPYQTNLEAEEYYIEFNCLGCVPFDMVGVRVTFRYVDIFPS